MPLLRPSDADALRAELRQVAATRCVPVLFGGEVNGDTLLLSEFFGTRTTGLRGLTIRASSGLGGASMVAGRPLWVTDYLNTATITHDYDKAVLAEGMRSVLAAPVLVNGQVRAMLYGAYRSSAPFGDRIVDPMVAAARRLGSELAIRDEVDRRLRLRETHLANLGGGAATPEQIREVHAELRRLAVDAPAALQDRLLSLADRLAGAPASDAPPSTPLTSRELDVLAQVALGCTNAVAAQRLSLKTETVKSYLRSASTKLGTSSRHEAVSMARRSRLIP